MTEAQLIAILKTMDRPTTTKFMNHVASLGHNVRQAQRVFEAAIERGAIRIGRGLYLSAR